MGKLSRELDDECLRIFGHPLWSPGHVPWPEYTALHQSFNAAIVNDIHSHEHLLSLTLT
jgi:hypothetical protein